MKRRQRGPNICDSEECFLYAARSESASLVKVGSTRNVKLRLQAISCDTRLRFTLLYAKRGLRKEERCLHAALREHRKDRHHWEWYSDNKAVRQILEGHGFLPDKEAAIRAWADALRGER